MAAGRRNTIAVAAPSAVPAEPERMLVLVTIDGEHLEVTESAASMSVVLRGLIRDYEYARHRDGDNRVMVPVVPARALARVLEYCSKHVMPEQDEDGLRYFDERFIGRLSLGLLHDVLLAANYLDVPGLLALCCGRAVLALRDPARYAR